MHYHPENGIRAKLVARGKTGIHHKQYKGDKLESHKANCTLPFFLAVPRSTTL
jgi:hypothetical protein